MVAAAAIAREWTCAATALIPATPRIDAHCHLGQDTDGSAISPAQLEQQLTDAAIDCALVTPLHQQGTYDAANHEVLGWSQAAPERFLPLWRCDPRRSDAASDARAGFAAGAVGLKLHPRAEQFLMNEPGVRQLASVAAEHRGVVLIHAGRGIPALGAHVLDLAREFPDATFVLAHAAVSDLSWVVDASRDVPNLAFDTAWWNPVDVAAMLSTVPPSRVLFGSDPPYGTVAFGVMLTARIARAVGYDDTRMSALFGGNIARAIGERVPASLAALPVPPADALDTDWHPAIDVYPRPWAFRRTVSYLTAATAVTVAGGAADEQLELAVNALELPADSPDFETARALRTAVMVARDLLNAGERQTGLMLVVTALTHAITPQFGIPSLDGVVEL